MKTELLGGTPDLSTTLPTTYITWTDLRSNLGLCGKRLETNKMNHGAAFTFF
jgi:hypothetical protein